MRHMSANNKQLLETDSDALPIKRRFRVPAWAIVLAIGAVLIALGIVQGDMLEHLAQSIAYLLRMHRHRVAL